MDTQRPVVGIAYAFRYESIHQALRHVFEQIGGIKELVYGKTVAVKVNLAGWGQLLLNKPAVETYVVHGNTAFALISILLEAGARRVNIVESAPTTDELSDFAQRLGWEVTSMVRLGNVEFINTRNGDGHPYTRAPVRDGKVFDWFDVNSTYTKCDVMVSLGKLKNHCIAGVTLSLKNMFGMPPNALYGLDAPSETSCQSRLLIHDRRLTKAPLLPGERMEMAHFGAKERVPYAIVDMVKARPIHLAVIEGITTVSGGEGPWNEATTTLKLINPGVVIVGRDAVATDAVATAVMGYEDPLSSYLPPFHRCENHLRIAHDAGVGVGDLSRIEVRGLRIQDVRTKFAWL